MTLISHGTPSDGTSVGITLFIPPVIAFAFALEATIAASRRRGSAISVAMFTSIIVTMLPCDTSPGASTSRRYGDRYRAGRH